MHYLRLLPLLVLAACGAPAKRPTFAQVARLPDNVSMIVALDVEKLKQAPIWAKVVPHIPVAIGERDELDKLKTRCDLDPFRDIRWVVYAVEAGQRVDRGILIVNGAFDRNKFDRCIAQYESRAGHGRVLLAQMPVDPDGEEEYSPPPSPEPEETGPFRRYGEVWVGWLAPDTAVIAENRRSLPFMRTIIEGKPGRGNPALRAQLAKIDPDATAWFVGYGEQLSEADPINSDVLKHATGAALSIRLGRELRLRFSADQSGTEIHSLARYLEKRLHEALEDLAWLDRFQVSTSGNAIVAELTLDAAALDVGASMLAAEVMRDAGDESEPIVVEATDRDGDGRTDDHDQCPGDPEDVDGFRDDDGCPDPDNDADTVLDSSDACPSEPGPRSNRGCPVQDRDGDGLIDSVDRCPDAAEDKNAFQDEDGCPDEATAKAEREKQAKSRSEQGRAYLDAGVYDKAIEEFRAAYALVPVPKLLYNIAVAYYTMRDRQNALDYYKRYVAAEPDDPLAKEARKRIAELTKALRTR